MTAAEAMAAVKDGDRVWMGVYSSVPPALCEALAGRASELRDVTVFNGLTAFDWDRPEVLERFRVVTAYASAVERPAVQAGRIEVIPFAGFREGRMPNGWEGPYDVAAIPISPPDEEGYCSFGGGVMFGPSVIERSRTVIGEVHPEFIRTGGQNRVHVSRFHRLAEAPVPMATPPLPPRSEETTLAAEVICTLTASELIADRSTVQLGVGDVSAAMFLYLGEKQDLGVHTELLPEGIAGLVKAGVVTGRYKEVHAGKVVASLLAALSPEETAYIDGNEAFELYDFNHTDDMRVLLQFERFVAVNNALFVDATGNACAETWGPKVFSGPGGQPTFAYAASVTNAHSIIVLPSSQLVGGERHSRILPVLPEGSTITAHRAFVDYVVTEQGIAHLSGKSLRERASELVSIAHPDFRSELREEVRRLYDFEV